MHCKYISNCDGLATHTIPLAY